MVLVLSVITHFQILYSLFSSVWFQFVTCMKLNPELLTEEENIECILCAKLSVIYVSIYEHVIIFELQSN